MPAVDDGFYRSTVFRPGGDSSETSLVLLANEASPPSGGDSGGPDIVTVSQGPNQGASLGIAAVQSTCRATGYVPGMPTDWTWATGISACWSAAVNTVLDNIRTTIKEQPLSQEEVSDRDPRGKNAEQCAAARQRNEARCRQFDTPGMLGCNAQAAQLWNACNGLAVQAAAEVAADRDPRGKNAEQCAAARQRNEARCRQFDTPGMLGCNAEAAQLWNACNGLAAQAAAGGAVQAPGGGQAGAPPAGGRLARVILPVEVFDAANGVGKVTGDLAAGAVVTIVAEPGNDWFEVAGDAVPGGRGFVYSGESYRSLKDERLRGGRE